MNISASAIPSADSFLTSGDFWSNVLIVGLALITIASWRTRSKGRLIPRVLLWGFTWLTIMTMGAGCDTAAGKFEQMQNEANTPADTESPSPTYDPTMDNRIPNMGLNPNGAYIPAPGTCPNARKVGSPHHCRQANVPATRFIRGSRHSRPSPRHRKARRTQPVRHQILLQMHLED